MNNIGVYMRYSTVTQDIKVQEKEVDDFIEYYRKNNDVGVVVKFIDKATSGKNLLRPEWERLKNNILNGSINTVVSLKLDRLGRKLGDLIEMFDFFETQNVTVVIVKDNIDTSSSGGKLYFQMMGAFAEFDRNSIIERLQAGREYAKVHGTKSGNPLNRPKIELNNNEIKRLYLKGVSLTAIGKLLGTDKPIHPNTIKDRLISMSLYKKSYGG